MRRAPQPFLCDLQDGAPHSALGSPQRAGFCFYRAPLAALRYVAVSP